MLRSAPLAKGRVCVSPAEQGTAYFIQVPLFARPAVTVVKAVIARFPGLVVKADTLVV